MTFQLMQRFILAIGLNLAFALAAFAQDCNLTPSILIHSCESDLVVRLRVLPDKAEPDDRHLLTVAGTYSSGDRFGIEGLVIQAGKIVSRRYQKWDGVLIIDQSGAPHLYNAKNVVLGGDEFDLKNKSRRDVFIAKAKESGVTVLQSHLLISDGILDLNDVEDAPSFKRRMLVSYKDGSFAVWETDQSETLYDAAHQVKEALDPSMALNLDMGAYDYCRTGPMGTESDCGGLLISVDKLTNLLEFSRR